MTEEVKNFIDKMAQNDMVGAGDAFKDALRSKVGDSLDKQRQDVAGTMFKAEPHSDPKPEIADPGTFTKEGEVVPTTDAGKDGEAQIDLSQPEDNGTPDTMVGVDVNAGEQNN